MLLVFFFFFPFFLSYLVYPSRVGTACHRRVVGRFPGVPGSQQPYKRVSICICKNKIRNRKGRGPGGGRGGIPRLSLAPGGGSTTEFCRRRQTPRIFHWRHKGPAPNPAAGGGRHRGVHMSVLIIKAGCYTVKREPRTTTYSTRTTAEDPDQTAGAAICFNCRRCVVNPLWHSGH